MKMLRRVRRRAGLGEERERVTERERGGGEATENQDYYCDAGETGHSIRTVTTRASLSSSVTVQGSKRRCPVKLIKSVKRYPKNGMKLKVKSGDHSLMQCRRGAVARVSRYKNLIITIITITHLPS